MRTVAIQITGYLNWTVRMGCEMEARITSVERSQEYAELRPEAAPVVDDYRPPKVKNVHHHHQQHSLLLFTHSMKLAT